jgi:hypothetical protein
MPLGPNVPFRAMQIQKVALGFRFFGGERTCSVSVLSKMKTKTLESRDLKNFNIKVKYIRVTELLSHLGITILITIGEH